MTTLFLVAALSAGCSADAAGAGDRATNVAAPSSATMVDTFEASGAGAERGGLTRVPFVQRLEHVHGLVVDGDRFLAGTHAGLWRVDHDGAVSRVGYTRDDLMGMSGEPGTGQLVSSGHPADGDRPDPLGLMVSDDRGATWREVSLAGEVDFHALAVRGEQIVGHGGPGLLISEDGGRTWADGAAIQPAALVITDGTVWATTAEGLQRSDDGGLSFEAVPGAPGLVLLAAGADGSLWGVDRSGVAWRSRDGAEWEKRVVVGPVHALAASGFDLAHAVTDEYLLELR